MSNYVIWYNRQRNNECTLRDFVGMDNTFPLTAGLSLEASFPDDSSFAMDADEPTKFGLTDSLSNTNQVIVASEALSEFFKKNAVPSVEYLPTKIIDHKGRLLKDKYFILHPINPVDCLNLDGVEVEYSLILPDQIDALDRIVLHEDKIPSDRVFFRCLNFSDVILVKRSFADAISAAGFTGFKWRELSEYS